MNANALIWRIGFSAKINLAKNVVNEHTTMSVPEFIDYNVAMLKDKTGSTVMVPNISNIEFYYCSRSN